jgi:hypothetical protein
MLLLYSDEEVEVGFRSLLAMARHLALHKIVIKRPVQAPKSTPDVTGAVFSRDTRYDIILQPQAALLASHAHPKNA